MGVFVERVIDVLIEFIRGCDVKPSMSRCSPPWPCISIERSDVVSFDGLDAWVDR